MSTTSMSALTATNARTWIERKREVPTPGEGEVLIQSRFVAVNNADVLELDRAADIDEAVVVDVRHTLPLPEDFPARAGRGAADRSAHRARRAPGRWIHARSDRPGDRRDVRDRPRRCPDGQGPGNLAADVRSLTDDEGVDLVLEHVAGPVLTQAIFATRRHGTVVQMGRLGGSEAVIDVDAVAFGRVTIVGVSFGDADELAELLSTVREQVLPMVLEGRIRPVLHAVLPFAEANQAVRTIRANRAVGKVVLALP